MLELKAASTTPKPRAGLISSIVAVFAFAPVGGAAADVPAYPDPAPAVGNKWSDTEFMDAGALHERFFESAPSVADYFFPSSGDHLLFVPAISDTSPPTQAGGSR